MPQLYRLSPLLLLIGLLACSRDQDRPAAQGRPAGAASRRPQKSPVVVPVVPPLSARSAAPNSLRNAEPAAAAPTAAPTVRLRTTRHWCPVPGPPVAADTLAATTAVAADPDALRAWLDAELPRPTQRFVVQPGRDTVIYGAQGTAVAIPADAFVLEGQPEASVAGPVEVELREFYALADILLQNLSTTSGDELLETGGMLHLAARTATGQPCALRPGTELLLRMPTPARRPDMQLFAGVATPQRRLDWQRPRPEPRPDEFRGHGPVFPGRVGALKYRLARSIRYSWDDYQRLRGAYDRSQRPALRDARLHLVRRRKLMAFAQVTMRIDTRGQVTEVVTSVTGDTTQLLAAKLRAAAMQLPRFRPAYVQGPIKRQFTSQQRILSEVPRKRRRPAGPALPRMPVVGSAEVAVAFARNGRVTVLADNLGSVGFGAGKVDAVTARQRLNAETIQADSIGTYLFSAANLGWVNCDRFIRSDKPRVNFAVRTGPTSSQAQLVFRRYRAVLGGAPVAAGQHLFSAVPDDEPVTVVAMKYEQGRAYLALQPTTVGRKTLTSLDFRPVTPSELRAALARLER